MSNWSSTYQSKKPNYKFEHLIGWGDQLTSEFEMKNLWKAMKILAMEFAQDRVNSNVLLTHKKRGLLRIWLVLIYYEFGGKRNSDLKRKASIEA